MASNQPVGSVDVDDDEGWVTVNCFSAGLHHMHMVGERVVQYRAPSPCFLNSGRRRGSRVWGVEE